MPEEMAHLSAVELEQLAEGTSDEAAAQAARIHLSRCSRCAAEMESVGALFAALEGLPRFAPSPLFQNAVMARVQLAANESWYLALLRRLAPSTRRGWMLLGAALAAPAIPFLALGIWLLFQPLVTFTTLWQWTQLKVQAGFETSVAWVLEHGLTSLLIDQLALLYGGVQSLPTNALSGAIAFFAFAIPLSAWTLVRLTRSPNEKVFYAK